MAFTAVSCLAPLVLLMHAVALSSANVEQKFHLPRNMLDGLDGMSSMLFGKSFFAQPMERTKARGTSRPLIGILAQPGTFFCSWYAIPPYTNYHARLSSPSSFGFFLAAVYGTPNSRICNFPVAGETPTGDQKHPYSNYSSYIAASYVKVCMFVYFE
jgi:hypothetical protein